ncbi:MAG: tRNA (adenosine(37)-N6)-threonylcarbamoyltransferase complex ATPase subunit type 1 TsaE [Candidatus Saccharibacteria bacterium]|nr:tRNA (adenosine(37)-N6)-threonylcarbamoyltransferase complex ATPase subunit type 1 TsaE [Candidatus Saccharibacteria bacterium]
MKLSLYSPGSEGTETLAEKIGVRLRGGEVVELISDLGGGKTTFMRGLVRGAKSKDVVASPTFTVSKVYATPDFEIHHFDFYRLPEPGLIEHELEDLVGDPSIVVAVEWGQDVRHVLPENRLTLRLLPRGEAERALELECAATLDYLLEGLQ